MPRKHQDIQNPEHPTEMLRRLHTEAFTRLVELWPQLTPELQRRRLGWLVGQCSTESTQQLLRYIEARSEKL